MRSLWLLVLALTFTGACAPKHPDPQAQAAQVAREVIQRLGELQSAAMAANEATPQTLSDADAVTVVRFTTASIRTVQQTPYGWGPSVTQAYTEVKRAFGTHPKLAGIFALIDLILQGVAP